MSLFSRVALFVSRLSLPLRPCAMVLSIPLILLWAFAVTFYSLTPFYADHIEPTMVIIAQQWMHGRPIYHPPESSYQYSMLYGPAGYLWLAFVLKFFSNPILASKMAGGAWALLSFILLTYVFRRQFGWIVGIAGLGIVTAGLLASPLIAVYAWDRTDPILIASTCLGLCALVASHRYVGIALLAIAIALAVDSKIHGFLYLFPAMVIWLRRHGFISCLVILAISAVLAAIPFFLPDVSLWNYLERIKMAGHHGFSPGLVCRNLVAFFLMLVPLAFLPDRPLAFDWIRAPKEQDILFFTLLVAGCVVLIPASKEGAGPTHFLPFVPYVGYLFCFDLAALPARTKPSRILILGLMWFFAAYSLSMYACRNIRGFSIPVAREVQTDLHGILQKYPASEVQMGVGDDASYLSTFYSPWIYREGTPRVLDIASFMDSKEAGIGSDALTESLREERFRYWLIPRDTVPFSIYNWYDNTKPLFDKSVAQTFLQHYAKAEATQFFDVYKARTSAP